MKNKLFNLLLAGSFLVSSSAIADDSSSRHCLQVSKELPKVNIQDININAKNIWSKPVAIADSFTGEVGSPVVIDKHWEDRSFSPKTDYVISVFGNHGIAINYYYFNARTGIILTDTIDKTLEIKVGDSVYKLTYNNSNELFMVTDELREALRKTGSEIKVRGTTSKGTQYTFPVGQKTIEAYKEIDCSYDI